MSRGKRYSTEQIIKILREVEIYTAKGQSAEQAVRSCGIWRAEGLKVPMKHPKKGRLWLNDGSCIRLRPSWNNHI